ncbi:MAG: hypothetical protein R6U96_06560 [Promethearchaeia archaeon]
MDWLKEYINSENKDNSFLLGVGFPGAHDPFDCVEKYVNEYDPESKPSLKRWIS